MKPRDYSLDAIKGIGCILMIFAHAKVNSSGSIFFESIIFLGTFAPILFFAVSGITATFQVKKNYFFLVLFYTMFAFLGLSYNTIWQPNLWQNFLGDLPQIIAICVAIIIFLEKYLKPQKNYYIFFTAAIFLIHYFLKQNPNLLQQINFNSFLISPVSFAVIPWISMFFTGVFAYYTNNFANLTLGIVSLVSLFAVMEVQNYSLNWSDKYDMSVSYYLISQSIIFFCFYLFRSKKNLFQNPNNIVLFFGKNSLLFLYIHLIILKVFQWLSFRQAFIVWFATLVLTYIMMKLSQSANKYIEKYFHNIFIWIAMIVCICIIPLIFQKASAILIPEMILGVLFANNYQSLSNLLKQRLSNARSSYSRE